MAVKSSSWKEARRVLKASGLGAGPLLGLVWPFGRERRVRALLRERRAVLEAKNHVVDYLSRAQRALAPLALTKVEAVQQALRDPEKRRLIMSVGVSTMMMEEVVVSRFGAEGGQSLGQALAELLAAGMVMKIPDLPASSQEVYLLAQGTTRPHFDLSPVNRLLQEGRDLESQLQQRLRRAERSERGRTHRL